MQLHNFHSSSTSYRVRIALALKGVDVESIPVRLAWKGGDHERPEFARLNPQRNVPVLIDGDYAFVQSLAIIEYLDEKFPHPPLIPRDPAEAAWARAIALHIACEIQPMCNLRVERYLAETLALEPDKLLAWRQHWIGVGFDAVEAMLTASPRLGTFSLGDEPGLIECALVPQARNATRPTVGLELSRWSTIDRIVTACLALEPFKAAAPSQQAGYEEPARH